MLYCCDNVSSNRQVEKLRNVLREIIRERFSDQPARSTEEIIQFRQKFYELINDSLNIIAKDYPALDVKKKIDEFYAECRETKDIDFQDDEVIRACEKVFQERCLPSKFPKTETETVLSERTLRSELKCVGKRMQKMMSIHNEALSKFKCLSPVLFRIESNLADVMTGIEHFDLSIVKGTIERTKEIISSDDAYGRHLAHIYTRKLLTYNLERLQLKWETTNSIMSKFKEQYDIEVMWEYFVMVSFGERSGGKLFSFLLKRRMANCLIRAFEAEAATLIVNKIKKLNWIYDAKCTTRFTDLHLLSLIEKNDVNQLTDLIASPAKLLTIVIEAMARNLMPKKTDWQQFLSTIKEVIELSAEETLFESRSLASKFLDRLIENFSTKLESCVLSRELNMCVKKEYKDIDKMTSQDFFPVCQLELFKAIDEQACPLNDANFKNKVCQLVVEYLRAENASLGMPRCEYFCPLCRAMCIREAGHDPAKVKHDAVHQPAGLGGTCDIHSRALDWKMCIEYEDDTRLFFGQGIDNNGYFFRDWSIVFCDWEKPHFFRDWPLREYILYHYHQDFAKFYDCKPCEELPKFYKRDLNKIRDVLEKSEDTEYP